ncbi:hypothetical protein [Paenibacillus azoreducens]|uniref:Uncharacterized protein n=1 Tax=Paenibacillus azoreducens TaxID=116718 RepID=A0A919Y606_9BACL|nr:hypothetical protein [Paenibacillus azoreducens]GIO45576.1 hypothetical protein J34TS1_03410 [Paenibacillus azoreducens]
MKYEFWIMASITELVDYPDEQRDEYVPHPNFQAIMDALGIPVPIKEIYEHYFDQPVHNGDVLVFANKQQPDTCIVLDTYRDPLDQLDMIQFGWRLSSDDSSVRQLRQLSRRLYDDCDDAVRYEEGQSVLYQVLKEERYPRKFYYNTVYEQQIKRYLL